MIPFFPAYAYTGHPQPEPPAAWPLLLAVGLVLVVLAVLA